MSAGESNVPATCKDALQVRLNGGGRRAAPAVHGDSVVKESLTSESGAVRQRAATIKFGLMVAQIPVLAGRATAAHCLWKIGVLEDLLWAERPE